METKRKYEEIVDAIEQLKQNKENIQQRYDIFGVDNYAMIDVSIFVLENLLTEQQVNLVYKKNTNEWFTAMGTVDFLAGEYEISDLLFPKKTN